MGDPVSAAAVSLVPVTGGASLLLPSALDKITGQRKPPPPPPAIPGRADPEVQAQLRKERRGRLRGRASLVLSQPTVGATGSATKELLGG